jgi:nitroimidazol reductase NimA-like FMN-containing flavoprotein (pyridoxamine 5'-phosphate oxidase superfamily)
MDAAIRSQILSILAGNRDMTIATLRPDGWPQATTVGFANDGFTLYFLCGLESQKAANLARDDRVSITVDHDTPQVMEITGLSMAARAARVTDPAEAERALRLLMARYPEQQGLDIPMPKASEVALFRVTPEVISVLDYAKGFGHTELVRCEPPPATRARPRARTRASRAATRPAPLAKRPARRARSRAPSARARSPRSRRES